MQEPTLVILAAGMGSRFGGLKQITAVDDFGHAIIDFSLYDAWRAGFRKVVFIIKHEIEEDFKAAVGRRMEKYFDVKYVFQQIDMLPEGYSVPVCRKKPWGTAHAVLCAAQAIDGPFAVINADDFYGRGAFETIYRFLACDRPGNRHAMVAYLLRNTVTEHGTVSRGVCQTEDGHLTFIKETLKIQLFPDGSIADIDSGERVDLPGDTVVSMNFWGFGQDMLLELRDRFPAWLDANLPVNPEKAEYFLPFVTNALIHEGKGTVEVLPCHETWHGITYKEDMPDVVNYIAGLRRDGVYPDALLD